MNREQRWKEAENRVLEIIADDAKWEVFVQQVEQHGISLNDHKDPRGRARDSEEYRALLSSLYITAAMRQLCDTCDYNAHQRRGERSFAAKRRFDCDFGLADGQETYEQSSVAPPWLDVARNLCPHYYLDLSR